MITETYDSKCGISGLLIVNPIMEYEDNSHKKGRAKHGQNTSRVRHIGFEPTTLGLEVPRSIQLS